jgi:hypothetical protein
MDRFENLWHLGTHTLGDESIEPFRNDNCIWVGMERMYSFIKYGILFPIAEKVMWQIDKER